MKCGFFIWTSVTVLRQKLNLLARVTYKNNAMYIIYKFLPHNIHTHSLTYLLTIAISNKVVWPDFFPKHDIIIQIQKFAGKARNPGAQEDTIQNYNIVPHALKN